MKNEEQIRVIELLMKHLDEGVNVDAGVQLKNPTEVYRCPDMAMREWETFFRNHPQVIGMSADLPEPGTFITCSDFGVPVLATRDQTGAFRAFVNICRHRGVLLEGEARGKRARFACPFHAWTYSNEGELVAVPKEDHFGAIDKSCHGLTPLPAVEKHGFLWVHPKPDGKLDTDELLGQELAEEFDAWRFDRMVSVGSDTYETKMNWKLGIDTFGETYHFKRLHKNTLAPFMYGNVQTYDRFGRNHRMGLCFRSIDELRNEPRENWDIRRAALPVYYLFPNVQLNVLPRSVVLVRIYPDPDDAGRAVSRISFYASPEALKEDPDFVKTTSTTFGEVIRDEDFEIAALSQLGVDSRIHDHVIFGRNEPALHHYHNTYRAALGLPPLEEVKA